MARTAPARDASIAVLSTGATGASFSLLTLGQSGGVKTARSFTLPLDACATPDARVLAADSGTGSGYTILGECISQGKAFVVHVDAGLNVTAAHLWSLDGASHFGATAFTRTTTSQLALTGTLSTATGDGLFVARLDDAANITTIDQYNGPAARRRSGCSPTVVTPAESNGVFLAGGSNAQARAFVASVHEDGSVGFTTYPGLTNGHAPVFVPGGFAELPTTGFVMAASVVELTAPDSGGHSRRRPRRPRCVRSHRLGKTLPARESLHVVPLAPPHHRRRRARLVVRLSDRPAVTTSGTWAMKVFAKDGTLTDPNVTVTTLTMDDGAANCEHRNATAITPAVDGPRRRHRAAHVTRQ